ncbi:helix-turn-helix domain-containing protein [Streptomyces sp. NPDC004539]|uniref:helix-turn-helix domain-containing protein n=1 Tax=Streptomyces sp. NPDC004539 TaxID=3154280 RepID=UPI0033B7DABE
MEALTERLAHLDSHVHGAIRVVAFYDTLMRRRVDLPALVRASAGLAECVAGVRLHGTGRAIRFTPEGQEAPEGRELASRAAESASTRPAGEPSSTAPVTLDDEELGTVWLERPGPPNSLDEVLLDRLALAVAAVVERYGPARTTMADPALVELVICAGTDDAARARALRLLGFAPGQAVRAVAVRTGMPLDRLGGVLCPGRVVKAARVGEVGALLVTGLDEARTPDGVRAGIGGWGSPERSWREARVALRFTTVRQPVVRHAELGALALLAEVPDEVLRENPDVVAVGRIACGADELATLDAYCATGSLRRAAERLHLHHSSVARRLEQIGKALDLELTEPEGLVRARLALTGWRMLEGEGQGEREG